MDRRYHCYHRTLDAEVVLEQYPGLSARPQKDRSLHLVGDLEFRASYKDLGVIEDSYGLRIEVPAEFPRVLPKVYDIGGKISRRFHTNSDGSLCLGSPIRLFMAIQHNRSLAAFVKKCLIPFLYTYSYRTQHGTLPFGELPHGDAGIIQDYMKLFCVETKSACLSMLALLGKKKRVANKLPCPCGSGIRVGRCHNKLLNRIRTIKPRSWFRGQWRELS